MERNLSSRLCPQGHLNGARVWDPARILFCAMPVCDSIWVAAELGLLGKRKVACLGEPRNSVQACF